QNKQLSPRRTVRPTLLQGLLVCQHCGYAIGVAHAGPQGRYTYYRCVGRNRVGPQQVRMCTNPPLQQEQLDQWVWQEMVRLLEAPSLLQKEIDRRLQQAQKAEPQRQRQEALQREQTRLHNSMDRLLTAYQENLLSLEELRQRMPELRRQQQTLAAEL